jgi:hypothetical protein
MTKKLKRPDGLGISLTHEGPIFYCFYTNMTTMEEILDIERNAFIHATNMKYHLFVCYETENAIRWTTVGLN